MECYGEVVVLYDVAIACLSGGAGRQCFADLTRGRVGASREAMDAAVDCHWRRHHSPVSASTHFSAPTCRPAMTEGV